MAMLQEIVEGAVALKTFIDTARGLLGLYKDAQATLPADKQEAVSRALEEADKQFRIAEAQLAQGLGYPLCRCRFPPTPMLLVGYWSADHDVHECPVCKRTDAKGGVTWTPYPKQQDGGL